METNDKGGWLRHRNRKVFGVEKGSFGTAWKEGKVGDIYQDETYHIEPDFGWLNKLNNGGKTITGGEKMKSRISGIGLKVTKINGEPIWGRDEKVQWNDLRGNKGWSYKSNEDIEGGKRTIHVQRVAYADQKIIGSAKSVVDLGQGICMLKLPRDNGNVYLVVGVAKMASNLGNGNERRIKWDDKSGFVDEGWEVCFGIEKTFGEGHTLVVDGYENQGNNSIRVDDKSSILIGNNEGKVVSWLSSKNKGRELVGIVLGVAVKYKNWWEENFKTKNGNGDIGRHGWVDEVKVGSEVRLYVDGSKVGVICFKPEENWEPVGNFKVTASAKFTWRQKK